MSAQPPSWPHDDGSSSSQGLLVPRVRTVGDTLDGAFQVLRAAWPVGLVSVLLFMLLDELANWAIIATFFEDLDFLLPGGEGVSLTFSELEAMLGSILAAVLITQLVSMILRGAASVSVVTAVVDRDRGRTPTIADNMGTAFKRAPAIGVASIVLSLGLIVAIGLPVYLAGLVAEGLAAVLALVAIPAGLAGIGAFSILPAAIVLEERGPLAAVGRALTVTRRRLGRVMGVAFLLLLLLLAIAIGASLLAGGFAFLGDMPLIIASIVLGAALNIIGTAVFAGTGAMLLLDASARLEGSDLSGRMSDPETWGR